MEFTMDGDVAYLLKKLENKLSEKILVSSGKEKKIDIEYATQMVKINIKRHIEMNNNFLDLFKKLGEHIENLSIALDSHFVEKKEGNHCVLDDANFSKKKKEEDYLKEKQNNVENIVKTLTLTLLSFRENKKKLKEIFLFLYVFIFRFSFNASMLDKFLGKAGETAELSTVGGVGGVGSVGSVGGVGSVGSVGSDGLGRLEHDNGLHPGGSRSGERKTYGNCWMPNELMSLNKICEYECVHFFSKDRFISMFYSNKDVNKIIKKCLLYEYVCRNSINFLRESKFFFLLTGVIYYIENDLKLRMQIFNIILNKIYRNELNLKKYTLTLLHNPYICKIKKISNIF
ncbi:conserved Plasmodium protein, unknown function [Plasmodium ovale curtisi]|uniref:Uncharacterized protein n=1 Tax=Plasmodium ovale curtisi TaxID=864141 RepID=A0A1A8WNL9_PLAOA|nr:conserved Plasmodium protein, unknown function [Plasmodium ovale curtisi]